MVFSSMLFLWIFLLSTGSILYKSRKNPKWNPGIFQSAFLCMGRAALCFPYAVFRGSEFYRRNSD